MENNKLLFSYNGKNNKKYKIVNKMIEYKLNTLDFDGVVIKDIIQFVNTVQEKYPKRMPIHFNLGEIKFKDKLTYIFFECICNYLIETCKTKVIVTFKVETTIYTVGIGSSPLFLLGPKQKNGIQKFSRKYKKEIYKFHYRRIIEVKENTDPFLLSKIMSDIDTFLKTFAITKQYRDAITEVIVELAGNALEHTETDCLIDVDVTEDYRKKEVNDSFYGVNITIINFSSKLLGDSISEKIKQKEVLNDRHIKLINAYNIHEKSFDLEYTEADFYNIASFQHRISGRMNKEFTGGTGLTTLISRLEDYSDAYLCYVISGKRALFFDRNYLIYNEDKWIGFNDKNDFLSDIPRKEFLSENGINMPGTAYNLNFVLKKEEC